MPVISRFPYSLATMPDYSYTGTSVYTENPESGVKWRLVLTSSGTLTANKKMKVKLMRGQGGGGSSGAGNASQTGTDGGDGEIVSLENHTLTPGAYTVTIGNGGSAPTNRSGYEGLASSFGSILSAHGGSAGAYLGNGRGKLHTSIYPPKGEGGLGGLTTPSSGALTTSYYTKCKYPSGGYMYIRTTNKWNASTNGTIKGQEEVRISSTYQYPDQDSSKTNKWYQLYDGRGYVDVSECTTPTSSQTDTRAWKGNEGNPGVIILEG